MKAEDRNDVLQRSGPDQLRDQFDRAAEYRPDMDAPAEINLALGKNSQSNIKAFLKQQGVVLKFNSFARQLTIQRATGRKEPLTEDALRELWLAADAMGVKSTKKFFEEVLRDIARQHAYHPVREYVDGLVWDRVPRLDTCLIELAGAADTPLNRTMFRKAMIAAVRRVRKPGCKFDAMLVLEGPQGAGKSSIVRILGGDWASDCLTIGDDAKMVIEQTQGVWLVELAELAQVNKREVEAIKAMISRQADKARQAYGLFAEEVPRQFVMIATVNSADYLTDTTGNRRFWPIEIGNVDLGRLAEVRDQLWAEAAAVEAAGEVLELPVELRHAAALEQEQRLQTDPWEDALQDKIASREGFIVMSDALRAVGVDVQHQNPANHKRMAGVLGKLGFRLCRPTVGGRRVRAYSNQPAGEPPKRISLSGYVHLPSG